MITDFKILYGFLPALVSNGKLLEGRMQEKLPRSSVSSSLFPVQDSVQTIVFAESMLNRKRETLVDITPHPDTHA